MLKIENLTVKVGNKKILENFSLHIKKGETVALFGPNGSGKTSLLHALMGHPNYKITSGRIVLNGKDITLKSTDERARLGMGLAFQHPPKIEGLKLRELATYCARSSRTRPEKIEELAEKLGMKHLLDRDINKGFSGGEAKKSELLQLLLLKPGLVLLDEPDSGVDLENMAVIGGAIRSLLERDNPPEERKTTGIIITHTGHILEHLSADYGLVLYNGRIACRSDPMEILEHIRAHGYEGCIRSCG